MDWPGSESEYGRKIPAHPGAYCERAGIDRGAAAKLLLRTIWEAEQESLEGPPHCIRKTGLLSEADLRSVAREVWPEVRPRACPVAGLAPRSEVVLAVLGALRSDGQSASRKTATAESLAVRVDAPVVDVERALEVLRQFKMIRTWLIVDSGGAILGTVAAPDRAEAMTAFLTESFTRLPEAILIGAEEIGAAVEESEKYEEMSVDGLPVTTPKRRRKYQPKRRSRDGLLFADVERAFTEAERLVGTGLKHKGRGHCRRVSLNPHYANHAVKGAPGSVIRVRVPKSWNPRRLMPLLVVEKAAEIVGVPASLFIRREY